MIDSPPDPDRITAGRGDGPLGRKVLVFRETSSTNDVVTRLAEAGEDEGIVVIAESQTAGRGQFGRRWESAAGAGLWLSLLLRPQWPPSELPAITPFVAVALFRAITGVTGIAPRIKPPNDIFVGTRKTAGILTEARTGREVFAVAGIGINVRQRREDFPIALQESATSLELETGAPVNREDLAIRLLVELNAIYRPSEPPGNDVTTAYAEYCGPFRGGVFVIA